MKKLKKPEFKLWKEFKAFINKGSVLDLAVGMIIGSAFTAIVTALVKGILQPLINMIPLGDGKSLQVVLRNPVVDEAGTVIKEAVIMDFGAVISAIITFLLTAIVLFAIIKLINSVKGGFVGLKRDTKFLESLTPEEKATIKGKIATKKELKAIKAARDEAQKRQRRHKRQNPKQAKICFVKSATFSKRNKLKKQPRFSTKRRTRNNTYFIKNIHTKPLIKSGFLVKNKTNSRLSLGFVLFLFGAHKATAVERINQNSFLLIIFARTVIASSYDIN